jgi:CRP/FNR family transcriptional regulator, cyclic AMP receptor protein
MAPPVAPVLVRDPDLASVLEGERLRKAERDLIAQTFVVFEGPWDPELESEAVRGGIGLLLLEGLIVRRVGIPGRYGAELLGPGDLMRPWQRGEDMTLPFDTSFQVIEQSLLALLDLRFAARAAQYPEVTGALTGRAMERSRTLVVNMAIAHYPRIDRRLLMLMWHLADRWGRVTPDGIRIPLRLTHQLLADLVASRRPSVTSGLAQLAREGLISKVGDAWMLHGEPPIELVELEHAANDA